MQFQSSYLATQADMVDMSGLPLQCTSEPAGFDCPTHHAPITTEALRTLSGWMQAQTCAQSGCAFDPDVVEPQATTGEALAMPDHTIEETLNVTIGGDGSIMVSTQGPDTSEPSPLDELISAVGALQAGQEPTED